MIFSCAVIAGAIALFTVQPSAATAPAETSPSPQRFTTTRTFLLPAGRASRRFTFHERSGVILINRLTVRPGVRVTNYTSIPHRAGVSVTSWPLPRTRDPSLSCRHKDSLQICTQAEEWCPMPQATWHVHLVKLSGEAGAVRFDYLVAPPPHRA